MWLPAGPAVPLLREFSTSFHPPQALRIAPSLLTLDLSLLVARAWRPPPCFRLRRDARVWPHQCWLLQSCWRHWAPPCLLPSSHCASHALPSRTDPAASRVCRTHAGWQHLPEHGRLTPAPAFEHETHCPGCLLLCTREHGRKCHSSSAGSRCKDMLSMVSTCLLRSHATCKGLEYARTHTCLATTARVLAGGERSRSGAGGGGGDLANTCIHQAICII